MPKFKDGRVHFRNSVVNGLILNAFYPKMYLIFPFCPLFLSLHPFYLVLHVEAYFWSFCSVEFFPWQYRHVVTQYFWHLLVLPPSVNRRGNRNEPQCEKLYLLTCAANTQISMCIRAVWSVFIVCMKKLHPWLSKICPVKILIRLSKCTGWSESSLGAHDVLDTFSEVAA